MDSNKNVIINLQHTQNDTNHTKVFFVLINVIVVQLILNNPSLLHPPLSALMLVLDVEIAVMYVVIGVNL